MTRDYEAHGGGGLDFSSPLTVNRDLVAIGDFVFVQEIAYGDGVVSISGGLWHADADLSGNSYIFWEPAIRKFWSYAHEDVLLGWKRGRKVKAGTIIGRMGSSGHVIPPTAKVLHITMRNERGERENPEPYLRDAVFLEGGSVTADPVAEKPLRSIWPAVIVAVLGGLILWQASEA